MSGGVDKADSKSIKDQTGLVKEAMDKFHVNEETAGSIIQWSTELAQRKFDKWKNNYIKNVMNRLENENATREEKTRTIE